MLSVEPEVRQDDAKTLEKLLDEARDEAALVIFKLLLDGDADAAEAGLRVHLLAWKAGCHPKGPKTQRELAEVTGVSQSAVAKGIKSQCSQSPDFKGAFESLEKHLE